MDASFPPPVDLWVELLHASGAAMVVDGDEVDIHYACLVARSACCMDSSRSKPCSSREPMRVRLGTGQVVQGMDRGLRQLGLGDVARIHVPARLGYGSMAAGPIAPGSDLIFEVELVGVNGQASRGLPARVLRALLMLPAYMGAPSTEAAVLHPNAAKVAATAMASIGLAEGDGDLDAQGLPPWFKRLRGQGPVRPPESVLFDDLFREKLGSEEAVIAAAGSADFGAALVPGAAGVRHAPYASAWDGTAPLVLTGARPSWVASGWDWRWFQEHHGDDMVLCKQRAPIFEGDRADATIVAECTLREYMQCVRAPLSPRAHAQPQAHAPRRPYIYIYICICICIYIYVYVYIYIYMCVCEYVYIYVYIYI